MEDFLSRILQWIDKNSENHLEINDWFVGTTNNPHSVREMYCYVRPGYNAHWIQVYAGTAEKASEYTESLISLGLTKLPHVQNNGNKEPRWIFVFRMDAFEGED